MGTQTANSEIYGAEEAVNYFTRNSNHGISFLTKYLVEVFPSQELSTSEIAEFGIGNGANLFFLSEFSKTCHGYEIGKQAVDSFNTRAQLHHHKTKLQAVQTNVSKPFSPLTQYDLVIFGFFAYYCSDDEMRIVMQNTRKMLKPSGKVFVYDFACRGHITKPDARNSAITVHKRNLQWWCSLFQDFDLLDYRLFDVGKSTYYQTQHSIGKCDLVVSQDDDQWLFGSLFRLRS